MASATSAPQPKSDVISRLLSRPIHIDWYLVAYIVIFLAAILTRFAGLGDRTMSHDESLHTYYSWLLFRDGSYTHTPLMHGPILFHMTALMYALFGVSDFTARLYPAILGVLMVMFPLLFRRWLGRTGALLASLLILISPMLLFHHRYIREDTPSIFFTMVMVWCAFQYIDGAPGVRRQARWLYIFAAALLGSLGSKEVAFMYVAIFGLFLTVFFVLRLYQRLAHRPARTIFYALMFPALLGGVLALIMIAVISIAMNAYATLGDRLNFIGTSISNLTTTGITLDFQMFAGWSIALILALVLIVVGTALWAFRRTRMRLPWGEILLLIGLTLAVTSVIILGEELSKAPSFSEALQNDPDYDIIDTVAETSIPIVATWVISGAILAVVIYSRFAGWWRTLHRFPELDIMILLGTLVLPWLTALPVYLTGASPRDATSDGIMRAALVMIPLLIVSVAVGLAWNPKRWLISAAIFYALCAFFFTTMFTNPNGLGTGIVGSLGYWLDQQGVRRGSQPQYYYQLVIMPVYEYLPLIGTFLAMFAGLTGFWVFRRDRLAEKRALDAEVAAGALLTEGAVIETPESDLPVISLTPEEARRRRLFGPNRLRRLPFTLFVAFWAIYIFIAYTLAGEKMPWLATHLTLPMILVTAWFFGRVFDRIEWRRFREGGWIFLLLLPPLTIALYQIFSPFFFNQWRPLFQGLGIMEQQERNLWFAVIAVALVMIALIVILARRVGWRQFRSMLALFVFGGLALMTARTAWMAAYINYDYATEYLVYAHAAPGIKLMMSQIEDLSRRTAGEMNLNFAWGGNAWPVSWYFRDLTNAHFFGNNPTPDVLRDAVAVYASEDIRGQVEPILGDDYYRFEYMRMWWPSWNYYNLTSARVSNALDFSADNYQAGQIRRGIWDIFLNRDYTEYGLATNENYSLDDWNPGEKLYFYVRKDIAAQIWNLGVGGGTVVAGADLQGSSQCFDNWQPLSALQSISLADAGVTDFNHPLDIVAAADGSIYVADEFNNRVVHLSAEGQFLNEITGAGGALPLNRPNGVALDAASDLWVADTWNYRVGQYAAADGQPMAGWGQPGLYGAEAQVEPTDGLWAPRDIAVGPDGNVYVSDTGNKRIRVYAPDGTWIRDIGSAGSNIGQLDEPAGIAVGSDRLFVADTWNQRISVFDLDGSALTAFEVRGWYEDQGNRPYIALDETRNLLYVGDPDAGRVLVYDTQGNCVGSFGQPSEQPGDLTQFKTVGGIAVGPDGTVYVVDSGVNRILRFAPFGTAQTADSLSSEVLAVEAVQFEASQDVSEITAEATAQADSP